ncbi:MAG TPA: polysaccharide deacetylase family protein, partial [Gemmatimonadales bacterium]|nr:polysaccharide deacetylase family protein [Gemmatimonadales bacterium]
MVAAFLLAARSQDAGRSVAVTIDDLPVTAVSVSSNWDTVTHRLLAALRQHDVPAIGFVNERKLYVDGAVDSGRVAL